MGFGDWQFGGVLPLFCRSSGNFAASCGNLVFWGVIFVMREFTWMEGMNRMSIFVDWLTRCLNR